MNFLNVLSLDKILDGHFQPAEGSISSDDSLEYAEGDTMLELEEIACEEELPPSPGGEYMKLSRSPGGEYEELPPSPGGNSKLLRSIP